MHNHSRTGFTFLQICFCVCVFPREQILFARDETIDENFVRRKRPIEAIFLHCPMPRRGEGELRRNAAIRMLLFRLFTLNPEWNTEDVLFLGQMCGKAHSWHGSMLYWIDDHILAEESKNYIQHLFVVTRVRPDDKDVDNSDDLLSDDELIVDKYWQFRRWSHLPQGGQGST